MSDDTRAYFEQILADMRHWLLQPRDGIAEEHFSQVMGMPDQLVFLAEARSQQTTHLQAQLGLALAALQHLREDALVERNEYRLTQIDYALKAIDAIGKAGAE